MGGGRASWRDEGGSARFGVGSGRVGRTQLTAQTGLIARGALSLPAGVLLFGNAVASMRGTLSPCSPKPPPTPFRMPSHRPASPYWPLLPTGDHHRQLVPPQDRSRLGLLFPHTHRHTRGGLASLHTGVSFTPPSHDGFTPTTALTAHTGLKPPCWAAEPETRETPSSNSVFACRRQSSPEVDFTLSASIHTSTWISHPPKLRRRLCGADWPLSGGRVMGCWRVLVGGFATAPNITIPGATARYA